MIGANGGVLLLLQNEHYARSRK